MMKEDYDKFQEIVTKEWSDESEFRIKNIPSVILKVLHKDFVPSTEQEWIDFANWTPQKKFFFALDIYPVYFLKQDAGLNRAKYLIQRGQQEKDRIYWSERQTFQLFERAETVSKSIQQPIESKDITNYVFYGVDSFTAKPRVWKKSDIFPLTELEFEGRKFFAPRRWRKLLTDYYGDYMTPAVTHTHLDLEHLSERDRTLLQKVKTLEELLPH